MTYPGKIGGSNKLLTMREAAEKLRYSYIWFAQNYQHWDIPCVRMGRKVMFVERDLDAFIERQRIV